MPRQRRVPPHPALLFLHVGILLALAVACGTPAGTYLRVLSIPAAGVVLFFLVRGQREFAALAAEHERTGTALRRVEVYQRVFRQASDAILILDPEDGTVLDLNHRACEAYGLPRESIAGRSLSAITRETRTIEPRLRAVVEQGAPQEFETVHLRPDGTPIHFLVSASSVEFHGRRAVLSIHRDITDRKALEERLERQAFHDPLTQLANRALFRNRVEHAVAHTARTPDPVTVMFMDLDNFKPINDTLGHAAGDQLLIEVARRLEACVRLTDTVARLGGDEFAVLLRHARHPQDSAAVAERILAEMQAPFALEGTEVWVGASIGIASTSGKEDADELLRNADAAMYAAKSRGKGSYALFRPETRTPTLERLELEPDLVE